MPALKMPENLEISRKTRKCQHIGTREAIYV